MNNIKSIINQEFKKFPEIEIVILFGSALKGKLASKRDIDFIDLHGVNGHIYKKYFV